MASQVSQPPQPCSLNDLLRQHSRDRLYVQPLYWTALHLKLLKCRFFHHYCPSQPVSSGHPPAYGQDIDIQNAVRRLACSGELPVKQRGLVDLLEALSDYRIVSSLKDYLNLCYGGKPVAQLPCHVFSYIIDNVRIPFLAYIDHFEVASFREDSIPIPKCNLPVWRLRKITLARLQPTNIEQDPYLIGILIALAQTRQYASLNDPTARESSHRVHLLVTNRDNVGFLQLYTATITAAFLRKLDSPFVFTDSSLIVRCAHIPSMPIKYIKHEITIALEPPRGKKRPHNSSVITEQGASKRERLPGNEHGREEIRRTDG